MVRWILSVLGQPLHYRASGSPAALAVAGAIAVGVDLALFRWWYHDPEVPGDLVRGAVATGIVLALILSGASRPADHGLSLAGWSADAAWVLKLCALGLGAAVALGLVVVLLFRLGWLRLDPWAFWDLLDFHNSEELQRYVLIALVWAPLVEELVYRGLAYPGLAAVLGNRGAIFLSGPLFYVLHLVYQRPWFLLHYLVAGWILAWAFAVRGRLWVPVVLHSLANALLGAGAALLVFYPDLVRWLLGLE
jgi:membrane protease YdiL (CAAX protease family)